MLLKYPVGTRLSAQHFTELLCAADMHRMLTVAILFSGWSGIGTEAVGTQTMSARLQRAGPPAAAVSIISVPLRTFSSSRPIARSHWRQATTDRDSA